METTDLSAADLDTMTAVIKKFRDARPRTIGDLGCKSVHCSPDECPLFLPDEIAGSHCLDAVIGNILCQGQERIDEFRQRITSRKKACVTTYCDGHIEIDGVTYRKV